jgi:hypothetical protein
MLFETSETEQRQLAEICLSPHSSSNSGSPPRHDSKIINRVTTVFSYMNSIGIDPCSSERICSSMVRFCGILELDDIMNEWGKYITKPLFAYMSKINQYILRFDRKSVVLKYYNTTYDDGEKIDVLKQEIFQLQTIIDELVEKVLELRVDRAFLGMVMNHYFQRNRMDIAESLLIAMFGEDSEILPDFLKERDGEFDEISGIQTRY